MELHDTYRYYSEERIKKDEMGGHVTCIELEWGKLETVSKTEA
jgi:hypothetical protein